MTSQALNRPVDVQLSPFAQLLADRGIAIYQQQSFPSAEHKVEAPKSWHAARKRDSEMFMAVLGIEDAA
jgi:hypothetical protein